MIVARCPAGRALHDADDWQSRGEGRPQSLLVDVLVQGPIGWPIRLDLLPQEQCAVPCRTRFASRGSLAAGVDDTEYRRLRIPAVSNRWSGVANQQCYGTQRCQRARYTNDSGHEVFFR